jgi:hypothetical protein
LPSSSEDELKLFQSIDTFIQRLNDKQYEANSNASVVTFPEIHRGAGVYLVRQETVSEGLADTLHDYQISTSLEARVRAAEDADLWIKRAFTSGSISIGENFFTLVQNYKKQIDVLQKDNAKLSADNLILQGKYEECQRNLHVR